MPQDDTFATPVPTTPTPPVAATQSDDSASQTWTMPAPVDPSANIPPVNTSPDFPMPSVPPIPTTPVEAAPVDGSAQDVASAAPMSSPFNNSVAPVSDVVVTPEVGSPDVAPDIPQPQSIYGEVANRINESKNVLIALSSDPSVDELASAIGLSLYLDRLGKRATAIYSGSTPNALEFLKPEETFETSADTLQDFVIALNKDKADHLRYKIDGDYVKVYITPYKHRLSKEDLEFSYGDYNVDLVIALDVANGIDLDSALREHGRIMHDAVIINVTTGNPGKFGEIEWSDKAASSVAEMIATLLYNYGGENPIAKDEATAYLTGIVAATNRFANAKTTPVTMRLCSKLMESGANQQLVSKNITPDIDNELINFSSFSRSTSDETEPEDPTKLNIEHDYETKAKGKNDTREQGVDQSAEDSVESSAGESDEVDAEVTKKEHTLLDDLKAAEQSLAQASAETVPEDNSAALEINSRPVLDNSSEPIDTPESVDVTKALDAVEMPSEPAKTIISPPDTVENPATTNTPDVPSQPEINGVPEMNFIPAPDADILPPPPAPPVGLTQDVSTPDASLPIAGDPTTPLGSQPAMQDQVYRPQASDPGAFKIPGM